MIDIQIYGYQDKRMPTIKDVAKEAGVSIATVSYVLNNKEAGITENTRRQVLDAVKRVGYTPNVTARNLKANRSRLIGYAWHEVPLGQVNSVLDRFAYYLAQAAEVAGYHMMTFTHPASDPVRVYDDLVRTGRVDAFVLADTNTDDPRIRFLIDQGFPFVSFGQANPNWDFNWVDTEGRVGVQQAVEYLVQLGHQRIAMITWPEDSLVGENRLAGYRDGLAQAGIAQHPTYIFRGEYSIETGKEAVRYWLQLPVDERPTAVIAVTDLIAIGVINEAQHQGMVVGETLSVIGYDDIPLTQYLRPALTTIQQPIPEIGRKIIEMLEATLAGEQIEERNVLFAPKLIIRDSAGPPR
jgi:DNA-binding LacI/PurR family transcriptional regulator